MADNINQVVTVRVQFSLVVLERLVLANLICADEFCNTNTEVINWRLTKIVVDAIGPNYKRSIRKMSMSGGVQRIRSL